MSQKQFSRRGFLRIAAFTTAGTVLSACASGSSVTESPSEGAAASPTEAATEPTLALPVYVPSTDANTVDIWVQQGSIDVMKGAADKFMAENPDIIVNFVPMTMADATTNLLASIAAGAGAPDTAFIDWVNIQNFTLRDGTGLNDLSNYMPVRSDWVDWDLDLVTTKNGKLIGLPEDLGLLMMFYRRDVFDAAGLPSDPESVTQMMPTWDEMIEVGKKVTKEGERWMINHPSDLWGIIQQEGEIRNYTDDGEPILTDQKFVKAAEYARKAREAGIDANMEWWGSDWEVARNKVPGVVALYPCAAWWDQIIQPAAPDTKGQWGVVPLPSDASGNWGGSFFVYPEMSTKLDKAFAVTSYIEASDEGLTEYMKSGKFLPGYSKFFGSDIFTTPDPFYADQVWLKAFVDQVPNATPIHLDLNDGIANEELGNAFKNILENNADIQKELETANQNVKNRIAGT